MLIVTSCSFRMAAAVPDKPTIVPAHTVEATPARRGAHETKEVEDLSGGDCALENARGQK